MKNYNYKSKTSFIILRTDYRQGGEEAQQQSPPCSPSPPPPRQSQWWGLVCPSEPFSLFIYTQVDSFKIRPENIVYVQSLLFLQS